MIKAQFKYDLGAITVRFRCDLPRHEAWIIRNFPQLGHD